MKEKSLERQIEDLNDEIISSMMKRRPLSGPNDFSEWEKTHQHVMELTKQRDKLVALLPPVVAKDSEIKTLTVIPTDDTI